MHDKIKKLHAILKALNAEWYIIMLSLLFKGASVAFGDAYFVDRFVGNTQQKVRQTDKFY